MEPQPSQEPKRLDNPLSPEFTHLPPFTGPCEDHYQEPDQRHEPAPADEADQEHPPDHTTGDTATGAPSQQPANKLHRQCRDPTMGTTQLGGKMGEYTLVVTRLSLPQLHPPDCRTRQPTSWQQARKVQLQTTVPLWPQTPTPGTTATTGTRMGHHRRARRSGGHPPEYRHRDWLQARHSSPHRTPAAQPRVPVRTMAERTPRAGPTTTQATIHSHNRPRHTGGHTGNPALSYRGDTL